MHPYRTDTMKRRHIGKRSWQRDHRGRDWSDLATSQGMLAPPEGGRVSRWTLPYRLQKEYGPATDFGCLGSRSMREYIFVVSSHPV